MLELGRHHRFPAELVTPGSGAAEASRQPVDLPTGSAEAAAAQPPALPQHEVVTPGTGETNRKHRFGVTTKNPDGTFTTRVSLRPEHWYDSSTASWKPFDNAIRPIAAQRALPGFAYENSANGFSAAFADRDQAAAGGAMARLTQGNAAVGMRLLGARPAQVATQDAEIRYVHALPGVTIRYTVDGELLKEDIILETPAALRSLGERAGVPTLSFGLDLEGVTAKEQRDGGVAFVDSKGQRLLAMPRPFMADSARRNPGRSDDVRVALTPQGNGGVRLDLLLDRAWLEDPDRQYPIVVDPSLVTTPYQPGDNDTFPAKDTWVSSTPWNQNHDLEQTLQVGIDARTLLEFDTPMFLAADSIISSASLSLTAHGSGTGAVTMEAHRITTAWTENVVTWNTQPTYDGAVELSVTSPAIGVTTMDVTKLVRKWVQRDVPNYGLALLPASGTSNSQAFWSSSASTPSLRPVLSITYTVATRYGVSSHWTYGAEQNYGGGTVSRVNVSNGNLVLQHVTSAVGARGFPVELTHTYNSQDAYGEDGEAGTAFGQFYGRGWTFSHNIRLAEFDGGNGVKLKDGSGQWRAYLKDTDTNGVRSYMRVPYYDYTLTKNLNSPPADRVFTYTVERGQTKYYFWADGKLSRVEDHNGNALTYAYDATSGALTTITDVAARSVALVYGAAGGRLSQITDMAGRISNFAYSNDGRLTSIIHGTTPPDVVTTTFGYNAAGELTSITNPRGHTSSVDYQAIDTWDQAGVTGNWNTGAGCGTPTSVSQSGTQSL
ncbi:MAG: DNRLRE domain-containing protein, partial [Chloroflexi bacterium]|nr:DNRLRE domain-containing protein [Chloroflexota bacterium]